MKEYLVIRFYKNIRKFDVMYSIDDKEDAFTFLNLLNKYNEDGNIAYKIYCE